MHVPYVQEEEASMQHLPFHSMSPDIAAMVTACFSQAVADLEYAGYVRQSRRGAHTLTRAVFQAMG